MDTSDLRKNESLPISSKLSFKHFQFGFSLVCCEIFSITGQSNKNLVDFLVGVIIILNCKRGKVKETMKFLLREILSWKFKMQRLYHSSVDLFYFKIWSLILCQKISIFALPRSCVMNDDTVHTLASDPSWHCPGGFYTNNFTKVYFVFYHLPWELVFGSPLLVIIIFSLSWVSTQAGMYSI